MFNSNANHNDFFVRIKKQKTQSNLVHSPHINTKNRVYLQNMYNYFLCQWWIGVFFSSNNWTKAAHLLTKMKIINWNAKKISQGKIIFNNLSLQLSGNSLKCNIFVIIVLSMRFNELNWSHQKSVWKKMTASTLVHCTKCGNIAQKIVRTAWRLHSDNCFYLSKSVFVLFLLYSFFLFHLLLF